MPQPGRHEHQRPIAVGEGADDFTGGAFVSGAGGPNDDGAAFAANWRRSNEFDNVAVGGLNAYYGGDFNLDGKVNFGDWTILRDAHPQGQA